MATKNETRRNRRTHVTQSNAEFADYLEQLAADLRDDFDMPSTARDILQAAGRLRAHPQGVRQRGLVGDRMNALTTWHLVTNAEGTVLGVYPEGQLSNAQEFARRTEAQSGKVTTCFIHTIGTLPEHSPKVGQSVSDATLLAFGQVREHLAAVTAQRDELLAEVRLIASFETTEEREERLEVEGREGEGIDLDDLITTLHKIVHAARRLVGAQGPFYGTVEVSDE